MIKQLMFLLFFIAHASFAQQEPLTFPCRTAKLIVPWAAGGDTDIIFRTIVDEVNKQGSKPQLQVVNIPGRSGNKASNQFLRSKPDGCELLAVHQSILTSYLGGQAKVNWDGYQPVAQLTETAEYIGANIKQPYSNLKELQQYAKENPEKVVAVGSLGSPSHYVMLMIEDALGVKFRHVSYDGTRERATALLSGNAHIGLSNLAVSGESVKAGDLKLLASTSKNRQSELPDLLTAIEQGVNVEYAVRRGIVLPKDTSQEIINYYESIFKKAIESNNVVNALKEKGTEVSYLNSEEYIQAFKTEYKSWEKLAKKVGIYNVN